ncbi:hypothetical protein P8452_32906 [Trifolium repens]|nr:hypothetical protein P8452_32906 [Trifolium repens]
MGKTDGGGLTATVAILDDGGVDRRTFCWDPLLLLLGSIAVIYLTKIENQVSCNKKKIKPQRRKIRKESSKHLHSLRAWSNFILSTNIELTEKQVFVWFCHRRLKDKRLLKEEANAAANGRQDRSSGVIHDRGSGLGQDSCGNCKHGDYKYLYPKEVESHGLYNRDLSVADMTYGRKNHFSENVSGMDDTSSESSSFLQDRLYPDPQGQDPYETEPSRYPAHSKALPPLNPKGTVNMGYKPSGYLKVKGEIEHAAITAVKKQLGRNYREDGPLLGVEFDPLPPGAFECQTGDPVHARGNSFRGYVMLAGLEKRRLRT